MNYPYKVGYTVYGTGDVAVWRGEGEVVGFNQINLPKVADMDIPDGLYFGQIDGRTRFLEGFMIVKGDWAPEGGWPLEEKTTPPA